VPTADIFGQEIEYERFHPDRERCGRPTLVFLHEGLGSLSMWKDLPARIVAATGCPAVVYSRFGHGRYHADPLPDSRVAGRRQRIRDDGADQAHRAAGAPG